MLCIAPHVRASVHSDGVALLNIASGKLFLCNETGSQIWQGIAQGLSPEVIVERISREADVGWELVERHTSLFLAELERRGLVVRKQEC